MSLPSFFQGAQVTSSKTKHAVVQRSLSALGPRDVGIKITATAINPVDWKMRDYDAFINSYPAVLGSDAAGVVVATGSAVTDLQVDDRVFFQGIIGNNDSSTFQQYCTMPRELVAKTPRNMTDEQGAGVSLAAMAVATAFYAAEGHQLPPPWAQGGRSAGQGKAVAIIGGASSVGQYAVQFARLSGYERVITNASAHNHELLKMLGAHTVLDRSASTADAFVAAAEGYPLDFVFDGISGPATQKLGIQVLQATKLPDRHLVALHVVVPESPDAEAVALAASQPPAIEIRQVLGIGSSPHLRSVSEPLARALGGEDGFIAKGLIVPNKPHVVPGGLASLEEALAMNKKGVSGQKVVVRPFDA